MTKSIEEQAKKYASMAYASPKEKVIAMIAYDHGANWAAKARDAQWHTVVNELISAVRCDYGCKTNQDHGWKVVKCNCGVEKSLTKADQMLKEMGISL